MVEISVLVLAKNEEHNVPKCLDAIYSQRVNSDFEVVFIDSGSSDRTVEIARQYPVQFHQIPPEEFHHSRTRNLAASLSHGKYLVYLAMAVYGRHLPKHGSSMERQHALSTLYGPDRIVKNLQTRDELGYRYYHFSTVNAAIRREAWEATRFPDNLRFGEDTAIAKRMLDREWAIVYEPDAAVYHSHDYPAHVLLRRYFDIGVVFDRLGIWNSKTKSSIRNDGLVKVLSKFAALRHGNIWSVGQALWNDAAKASGLVLGRNERLLPLFVKRRLSAFKLFE